MTNNYFKNSFVHKLIFKHKTLFLVLIGLITFNSISYSQVTIASQRFNNGEPTYQVTIADKDGVFAPPTNFINTHVGTDDWDYTASTTEGIVRVVNANITPPASDFYCLEMRNYWDDMSSIIFVEQDISTYSSVTFSISYKSLGSPDNGDNLWLDYGYYNAGAWVDTSVQLIAGVNGNGDAQDFGVAGAQANAFVASIPDTATAFRATVRTEYINGLGGNDSYYIDDVILEGDSGFTAPEAYCDDFIVTLDAFGNATITPTDIDNGSVVYTGTATLSLDITDFDCDDIGTNIVALTVEDGSGATDTCAATVTVNGYSGFIIAPDLPDITTYCSYDAPTPGDLSYQCQSVTPTTSDATSFNTPGSYSIDWLYYDPVTNTSANEIQYITISALVAPTNITVSSITPTTATVDWDALSGITEYNVRYREVGTATWTVDNVNTNTIDITGLTANTDYEVQVSSVCNTTSSTYSASTTFTTIGLSYCTPVVPLTDPDHYINRVRFGSLATNIDNSSGFDNGYGDYTANIADVYKGSTETIQIDVNRDQNWMEIGAAVWIDLNGNGDFSDPGEHIWFQGGAGTAGTINGDYISGTFTIPTSAVTGITRMRVAFRNWWHPDNPCDGDFGGNLGEYEDYTLNLLIDPAAPQEIDILGNNNPINDGALLADIDIDNATDFGAYDVFEGSLTRTYTITNNGSLDLNLTGTPIVQIAGSTDFVVTQPATAVLSIGASTTFTITFDPSTIGILQATITINNTDSDENPYTFVISGEGIEAFPDTDGDGIPDNVDLDDDNDGLLDVTESNTCANYSYANQTEVVFLNETFGDTAGTRVEIDAFTTGVVTSYCYEDGTGTGCTTPYNATSLNDGEYTVYHKIANGDAIDQTPNNEIAAWADEYWYLGEDHTPGDVNGRMAIFNADENPGIFFDAIIQGVTPNVPITYGFSTLNIDRTDAPDIALRERPEVQIIVYDPNGNQIASATSGLIPPTSPAGDWVEISATFTTTFSQFRVQLINSQLGGIGNDLAIDDIFVKQRLCDLDGDGIADVIDLDNDNDGIPNVVELGLTDADFDATLLNDPVVTWVDANQNGVHDSYESITIPDTDGDGVPDYIDLDSDNDGIFDAVEYDGLGDIDISGNGLGNGTDRDDMDPSTESDGDGILAIVDLNDDGVGNDHGSNNYPKPLDSDGDGILDYLDTDSNDSTNNPANGTDISSTIYANLDANNDGLLDGNTDTDNDGILDIFDTDNSAYGSPRDLDDKYTLFFDGRNDYVEDSSVMAPGDNSLAVFIKSDGDNATNTNRIIVGQSDFYIQVNDAGNTVSVLLNGGAIITSSIAIPNNIWVHLAATTTAGETILYINGENAGSSTAGSVPVDGSDFTIGRLANTDSNYFRGEIEEVRVFNKALTEDELQRMVYQELDHTNNFDSGLVIPKEISPGLGASLVKYYKMDGYIDDIVDDKTTPALDQGIGAKLYNIKDIYFQTAPLPYETTADGDWTTTGTWLHGNVWDITDVANNKDWSIVDINHDITTNNSHTNLGLLIDNTNTLTVNGDREINNTWYLQLDGVLDLHSESQLVQTTTSDLVTSATGRVRKRQEGITSPFRYNYWGSPVGVTASTSLIDNNGLVNNPNNTAFTPNMLKEANGDIQFTTSYTPAVTTPASLSDYWFFTFKNGVTYYDWASVGATGAIETGIGYTQKGTGVGSGEFEYIFEGKPNNGTVKISATDSGGAGSVESVSKTEYLVGNPYASSIDAHEFINDNSSVIGGEIYLWEHWGGNSHQLNQYEGGYATLNLLSSVRAYQFLGIDGADNGTQSGTKLPTRYLPVGQGFRVEVVNSGDIEFNNSQRQFRTEASTDAIFFRQSNASREAQNRTTSTDSIMSTVRLKFTQDNGLGREIVLGFSDFTTDGYDYGYDAQANNVNPNDLTLPLGTEHMVIQGYAQIETSKVVDLYFVADGASTYTIEAINFENLDVTQNIYLRDNLEDVYFDLHSGSGYTFTSQPGEFTERFDVVFQSPEEDLSTEDFELDTTLVYFNNSNNLLFVKDLKEGEEVQSLSLYNTIGQKVYSNLSTTNNQLENGVSISNLSTGVYVVSIKTEDNLTLDKKIIID